MQNNVLLIAILFNLRRNIILSKRYIVEFQLVESSYCRIVKLPKLYNVEYDSLNWV